MLRASPHLEDHGQVAGGDTTAMLRGMAKPIAIGSGGVPPGEDGVAAAGLENVAQHKAETADGMIRTSAPQGIDFLAMVRAAEDQALLYVQQVNRKAWSQAYRAFHNEHYVGSKYTRPDWRGRSKLFVPKTKSAVRKDMAAVAASLFNSIDAINCLPGNDGDPVQRGAAAVMEELVNYRVGGRAPGNASLPWFLVAMGARQDADLTGVCVSKQVWLQKHRKDREEQVTVTGDDGNPVQKTRDIYKLEVDRPDIVLFPPENVVIDSAADWLNPAQSAAFLTLKYPMRLDEIQEKQDSPVNPWNDVSEEILRGASESGKFDMAAIRRARELGLDRYDETTTSGPFQVIWVYETFVRTAGEDWTFYSIGSKAFLTYPRPVREVYPEQHGERPIAFGYGALESHRIFPMSPVESWQPLQLETNDLRNLQLDAIKQNVMPITKVRRGRQIDLNQVQRRSSGSAIIVQEPDDVTWEPAPPVAQNAVEMNRELDLEFDDLAGQQNYGTVENNNALGKTLGGLKLAAGAANAVQEFDIRVWIETWANQALTQIVRLEQFYEQDPVVLGIAASKAGLWKKFGISKIDDDLMSQDVTIRVSIGLGAGDPAMRLAKFAQAAQIVAPLAEQSPEFQSGQREINIEAVIEEVFGAVGYKDAGSRFFKDNGQARPNPMGDLQRQEIMAKISRDDRVGKAALFQGLSALAKVALGKRELESDVVDMLLGHQQQASERGFDHAHKAGQIHLAATDHGHRHGMAINEHRRNLANDAQQQAQAQAEQAAQGGAGGDAEMGSAAPAPAPPGVPPGATQPGAAPQAQPSASSPPVQGADALHQLLQSGAVRFTRGADGRISGLEPQQQQLGGPGPRYPAPGGASAAPARAAAPAAPAKPEKPKPDPTEERLKRLEAIAEKLSKPRHRNVVRDAQNRIVRIEDAA
jgi:hypothetical protein